MSKSKNYKSLCKVNWLSFCCFWTSQKIGSHFAGFEESQNWSYSKTPLGKIGCLVNLHLLAYFLTLCLSIQFFYLTPFSQHSQLGYLWLPCPHFAALAWLTGRHAIPLVTKCFPPNPCLGKQRISLGVDLVRLRISLGVAIILSMCLSSHTKFDCNQLD